MAICQALFSKAWRESRTRFLVGAVLMALYCLGFVQRARRDFPPEFDPGMNYTTFVWHGVYEGPIVMLFVLMAFVLAVGGLRRESALGTAPFTAALPVSRQWLVASRAVVGLLQVAALAIIPALIVPSLSTHYTGETYAFGDAFRFAMLFAAAGALWFAIGLLASVVFGHEHAGILTAVIAPSTYAALVTRAPVRRYPALSLFNIMNGARLPYLDPDTSLLVGHRPALVSLLLLSAAGTVLVLSAYFTARQDY